MLKCGLFGGPIVVVRSLMDVGEFIVVVAGHVALPLPEVGVVVVRMSCRNP